MGNDLIYKVKDSDENKKLREYLRTIAKLSGRLIKNAAMDQRIKVNGKITKLNYIVKASDVIAVQIDKEESQDIEPEKMDIDVVYEDSDMLVVNKSFGIVVHPTKSYQHNTLANGLLYYFRAKGENCIVRLVNRLDMDTSGLIIIAKNQFAHMALARDMGKDKLKKNYLAIVHGNLLEKTGVIDLPIYRQTGEDHGINRLIDERGQRSITEYEVIESYKDSDLVKLTLKTGRTHQIRVHLSHIGHPIFGDSLYSIEDDKQLIGRQALHAYKLVFPHPRTEELITLEIPIPEDMENLKKILKEE